MSTEKMEEIRKYKLEIEERLTELKKERQALVDKIVNGEKITSKENKQNKKLAQEIAEIENQLATFKGLENLENLSSLLDEIADNKTTKAKKDINIKKVIKAFKNIQAEKKKNLVNGIGLTADEAKNLDKTKAQFENEIAELETVIRVAKRKNQDTTEYEKEIDDLKYLLENIAAYEIDVVDIKKLEVDLNTLADSKTSKDDKTAIMITYNSSINSYKEEYEEKIINTLPVQEKEEISEGKEMETEENKKKSLKERTKEKLAKVSESLSKHKKKIVAVAGLAILTVSLIAIAKSCSKDIENSKNDNNDLDNKTNIEQTYENVDKTTMDALTNKGYNEYTAMLMAQNFDETTINSLKNLPYIPAVENYATVEEFNIDYINDYENAKEIYNITSDKAVDYVNRSAKIEETKFYNDATINDIVAVVKSIDEKNLFQEENNELQHSINAQLTEIYNNYLYTTEKHDDDVNKLEALKYFAKEGTELDLFLTEFTTLTQNVLNAKGNNEDSEIAKKNVYNYLDVFANTFAGNITDVENLNQNAVITDTYDWNIAYTSFIRPVMSMYITKNNAYDYACLQINMLSNYEQWAQANNCYIEDESLTSGGR